MLLVAPVLEEHRVPLSDEQVRTMAEDPDLRHRVNVPRSTVPAITHVDYSARVQTIDEGRNPRFHRLLKTFHPFPDVAVAAVCDVYEPHRLRGQSIADSKPEVYKDFREVLDRSFHEPSRLVQPTLLIAAHAEAGLHQRIIRHLPVQPFQVRQSFEGLVVVQEHLSQR